MNTTDLNCPLDFTRKFYTSPHLSRFYFPLSVFNCIIDACLPITSVGGSALLLAAVIKFPQLRDIPSNLLLASQAVSDLLIGLLIQPLITARNVRVLLGHSVLKQSNFLNGFSRYCAHSLLFSSCLNICLITLDRYICIAHSLRYQTLVTERRVIRAISASWLFWLAFATIQAVSFIPGSTIPVNTARAFAVIPPALLVFIAFICYFKMTKIARRHKRQIRAQMNAIQAPTEQDIRSTKTALLMVAVIFLCYVPGVCLNMAFPFHDSKNLAMLEAIRMFIITLAFLNPCINPLVYYARSRKIRRYVWKVLQCE